MRVVLYARQGPTDKNSEEHVEVQLDLLQRWCQANGYENVGEYADPNTSKGEGHESSTVR